MPRKLAVSLKRDEALRATRITIGKNKLVYVLVADKRLTYWNGKRKKKSRVVYIGTTTRSIDRIAKSVAYRAKQIFNLHGVRSFHARIITCRPRQNVSTWRILERALLLSFRERFGEVPKCNSMGKRMKANNEFDYFSKARLDNLIDELS